MPKLDTSLSESVAVAETPGFLRSGPPPHESDHSKRVVEVRGGRGQVGRATLAELWAYREVLSAFTIRAVKVKYSQTSLGVGWAVAQPLIATAIFAIVFGRLAKLPSEGAPYAVFALAGMVPWIYFSGALSTGVNSLIENSGLLRKVFFPREVLPLSVAAASLVDLVPGLAVFALVSVLWGIPPALTWIVVPIYILLLVLTVIALGLALGAVNVYYRDVKHLMPFVIQVGLYASPIVYSMTMIPEPARTIWAIMNPVAGAIDGIRGALVRHEWPDPLVTGANFLWVGVLLFVGYWIFKRLERGFADRV